MGGIKLGESADPQPLSPAVDTLLRAALSIIRQQNSPERIAELKNNYQTRDAPLRAGQPEVSTESPQNRPEEVLGYKQTPTPDASAYRQRLAALLSYEQARVLYHLAAESQDFFERQTLAADLRLGSGKDQTLDRFIQQARGEGQTERKIIAAIQEAIETTIYQILLSQYTYESN
ncbi:MAG: hypothetical protein HC880_00545 [Bacteroidia bacterium]|nr:hypothetical protein [Bacteroidia bacterium]